MKLRTVFTVAAFTAVSPLWAAPPTPTPVSRDHAVYQPKYQDPVLGEMEAGRKEQAKREEDATAAIRDTQKKRRETEKKNAMTLRFDVSGIARPAGPEAFATAFHFPPVAQYNTGTCWSFSTTSFYESEVFRLTGQQIKLSEIWTVYWEYVEKMRRFVRERGDSLVEEGSESSAVGRIWRQYGAVPENAYSGVRAADERHDHARLIERLHLLCGTVKTNDLWDEALVIAATRAILDEELGRPPETVAWDGHSFTPVEFLATVLRLNLDDYVEFMSTLRVPFFTTGEFQVPDNWWHDASYHNLPLSEWYAALLAATKAGYTVAIGGDVSEPGYYGFQNIAVIPSFDIPQEYIDQDARELRFDDHATQDDHGLHLVGYTHFAGHDWFLIKDSARSSRWGKFTGYYLYRDDYVRLKMLTFTVHKSAVAAWLAKFNTQ